MKKSIIILTCFLSGCTATPYVTIGAGYKFDQPEIHYKDGTVGDHPITARLEAGYELGEGWKVGISHHSQWFRGWPIDNRDEYGKTEFFIDKTWK